MSDTKLIFCILKDKGSALSIFVRPLECFVAHAVEEINIAREKSQQTDFSVLFNMCAVKRNKDSNTKLDHPEFFS